MASKAHINMCHKCAQVSFKITNPNEFYPVKVVGCPQVYQRTLYQEVLKSPNSSPKCCYIGELISHLLLEADGTARHFLAEISFEEN